MVSVTSEVSANTSFQNAAARSALAGFRAARRKRQFRGAGRQQYAAGKRQSRRTTRPPRAAPTTRRPRPTIARATMRPHRTGPTRRRATIPNDRNAAANARSDKRARQGNRDDNSNRRRQGRYRWQDGYRHQGRDQPAAAKSKADAAEVRWQAKFRRDDARRFRRRFRGPRHQIATARRMKQLW